MRDISELKRLLELTKSHFTKLTMEATVDTGFEPLALEECLEKFGKSVIAARSRGRIFFNTTFDKYQNYQLLRSVDHVNILSGFVELPLGGKNDNKMADLEKIKQSVHLFDWDKAVTTWQDVTQFKGVLFPSKSQHAYAAQFENHRESNHISQYKLLYGAEESKKEEVVSFLTQPGFEKTELEKALDGVGSDSEEEKTNSCPLLKKVPKFRVTCNRVGQNHSFTSMDAAWVFGGGIHDKFNWLINLTDYDIEIILQINENNVYAGISLNRQSKHCRNISFFGPTTLRATVCYNMLRLCEPKVGEIVIDPLCGGGSIPIEGGFAYPSVYHLCGDEHEKAVNRSVQNLNALDNNLKVDTVQWDATNLPLKTDSVDIFVTDLPFGKRSGSKANNKTLYKKVLNELARVVKLKTGRGVFLTFDKKCFTSAYYQMRGLWKQARFLSVNMGGLDAGCFVLQRTGEEYELRLSKNEKRKIEKLERFKNKISENINSTLEEVNFCT